MSTHLVHRESLVRILRSLVPLTLLAGLLVAVAAPAGAADGSLGRYQVLTPQRLLDTRAGGTPIGPGQTRLLDFGSRISPAVDAVVVNVTTVGATADGYLTLFPHGQSRPTVSNVRHPKAVARSSSVTVAVLNSGAGRYVDVFNNAGSVDLVVDLFGYYVTDPPPSGTDPSSFYPRPTAARVYDSRTTGGALHNGESRAITVTPAATLLGVRAVAVNLTVVTPQGSGYLQAWSGDGPPPLVSSVNFQVGRTTPNFAIIPVACVSGSACFLRSITVRNVSTSAHVVVDLLGYYGVSGSPGATRFVSGSPFRIIDSRSLSPVGRVGPGGVTGGVVGDGGSTPAVAANLTVTAVDPTGTTYLTAYRDGTSPPPTSTVNALAGEVVANATQIPVSPFVGGLEVRNNAGSVHVVVDVNGIFVLEE